MIEFVLWVAGKVGLGGTLRFREVLTGETGVILEAFGDAW
jgi:hypothetical protein